MTDTERLNWLISNKAAMNPIKGKVVVDFWNDITDRWEHKDTSIKIANGANIHIKSRQAIDELMSKGWGIEKPVRSGVAREKCKGFTNGDFIEAIIFDDDQELRVGRNCDSIIVVMENGQMARVPWLEVWKDGRLLSKWNAAKVQGVEYA